MRLISSILIVMTLVATGRAADSREAEIRKVEEEFGRCWDAGNANCLAKLITDDLVLVTRTGGVLDKAQFLKAFPVIDDPKNPAVRTDKQIRFYGPAAIITFVTKERLKNQPTEHVHTHVWVNTDGKGWRLASRHVSPAAQGK